MEQPPQGPDGVSDPTPAPQSEGCWKPFPHPTSGLVCWMDPGSPDQYFMEGDPRWQKYKAADGRFWWHCQDGSWFFEPPPEAPAPAPPPVPPPPPGPPPPAAAPQQARLGALESLADSRQLRQRGPAQPPRRPELAGGPAAPAADAEATAGRGGARERPADGGAQRAAEGQRPAEPPTPDRWAAVADGRQLDRGRWAERGTSPSDLQEIPMLKEAEAEVARGNVVLNRAEVEVLRLLALKLARRALRAPEIAEGVPAASPARLLAVACCAADLRAEVRLHWHGLLGLVRAMQSLDGGCMIKEWKAFCDAAVPRSMGGDPAKMSTSILVQFVCRCLLQRPQNFGWITFKTPTPFAQAVVEVARERAESRVQAWDQSGSRWSGEDRWSHSEAPAPGQPADPWGTWVAQKGSGGGTWPHSEAPAGNGDWPAWSQESRVGHPGDANAELEEANGDGWSRGPASADDPWARAGETRASQPCSPWGDMASQEGTGEAAAAYDWWTGRPEDSRAAAAEPESSGEGKRLQGSTWADEWRAARREECRAGRSCEARGEPAPEQDPEDWGQGRSTTAQALEKASALLAYMARDTGGGVEDSMAAAAQHVGRAVQVLSAALSRDNPWKPAPA